MWLRTRMWTNRLYEYPSHLDSSAEIQWCPTQQNKALWHKMDLETLLPCLLPDLPRHSKPMKLHLIGRKTPLSSQKLTKSLVPTRSPTKILSQKASLAYWRIAHSTLLGVLVDNKTWLRQKAMQGNRNKQSHKRILKRELSMLSTTPLQNSGRSK
jgi:hypothetical protein